MCVCVCMTQWILEHQMDVFGCTVLNFKEKLIYAWLCCVTVAACGLVVASRAALYCGAWAFCAVASRYELGLGGVGLGSCGTEAQFFHGT